MHIRGTEEQGAHPCVIAGRRQTGGELMGSGEQLGELWEEEEEPEAQLEGGPLVTS